MIVDSHIVNTYKIKSIESEKIMGNGYRVLISLVSSNFSYPEVLIRCFQTDPPHLDTVIVVDCKDEASVVSDIANAKIIKNFKPTIENVFRILMGSKQIWQLLSKPEGLTGGSRNGYKSHTPFSFMSVF